MIDATKITKFNATEAELEEHIIFWILAAGKNGVTTANCLDALLTNSCLVFGDFQWTPFEILKELDEQGILEEKLKEHGIGCYNLKAVYLRSLLKANLDLKKCTLEQLEAVKGIGPKTARCFLIHTRKNQQYAGLDTHILSFLRDKGINAPKTTPTGKKYKELEKIFLKFVKRSRKTVAEFDLMIWNRYRKKSANISNLNPSVL